MKTICYLLLMCFLVTELVRTADSADKCADGFTYLNGTGSCYRVVYESHNWEAAYKRCRRLHDGGHLVAITTAEENRAVKTYLSNEISSNMNKTVCILRNHTDWGWMFWTGGHQLFKDSNKYPFVWKLSSDRLEAFDYTSWIAGQPNFQLSGGSFGLQSYCVGIFAYDQFGWDDRLCIYDESCPLCEYKL